MNPLEWLKILYEAFGAKHPMSSLVIVMLLGALFFGLIWQMAAHQYQKAPAENNNHAGVTTTHTGEAKSSGPNSPAITGSGNTVSYGSPEPKRETKPRK